MQTKRKGNDCPELMMKKRGHSAEIIPDSEKAWSVEHHWCQFHEPDANNNNN
jgi:hypothetical protein